MQNFLNIQIFYRILLFSGQKHESSNYFPWVFILFQLFLASFFQNFKQKPGVWPGASNAGLGWYEHKLDFPFKMQRIIPENWKFMTVNNPHLTNLPARSAASSVWCIGWAKPRFFWRRRIWNDHSGESSLQEESAHVPRRVHRVHRGWRGAQSWTALGFGLEHHRHLPVQDHAAP